jgi:hypothetical protein
LFPHSAATLFPEGHTAFAIAQRLGRRATERREIRETLKLGEGRSRYRPAPAIKTLPVW